MGKINIGRVLIAGLVAGIVSDLLGYLVDGVLLAPMGRRHAESRSHRFPAK